MQDDQFCSSGAAVQAEGAEAWQAAAHLLVVIEVEVLGHVRGLGSLCSRESHASQKACSAPLIRSNAWDGIVDLLVEQGVVAGAVHGPGYRGMADQAVRAGRRLVVPVTALRYE